MHNILSNASDNELRGIIDIACHMIDNYSNTKPYTTKEQLHKTLTEMIEQRERSRYS